LEKEMPLLAIVDTMNGLENPKVFKKKKLLSHSNQAEVKKLFPCVGKDIDIDKHKATNPESRQP
jgi:hypothetical protein